jgi:hypothetical protein
MSVSRRRSVILRLAPVAAAILICGTGSAWAGDGTNLDSIQAIIGKPDGSSGFCHILNMNPCPQLPTVTQAFLEAAALGLSPPEMVAAQNDIPPGSNVNAGNQAAVPPAGVSFPLTGQTSPTLFDLMSTVTPLAFKNTTGTAEVTPLYDTDATTFVYAVTVSSLGFKTSPGGTVPDTLFMFYDDLSRTNRNFLPGRTVGKFLLPLTVLQLSSDGTTASERAVRATLQFIAPTADCSASKVTGDFLNTGMAQTVKALDLGLSCAVVFGPSPTSAETHAIFQLAIPLLVTGASPPPFNTDPAYFYSFLNHDPMTQKALPGPINIGLFTSFLFDDLGGLTAPNVLPNGAFIGVAPTAGPLCIGKCPTPPKPPATPPPATFALCASLPLNGNGQALVPAVGAYYAIATDGEMFLSAALPGAFTPGSVCPQL